MSLSRQALFAVLVVVCSWYVVMAEDDPEPLFMEELRAEPYPELWQFVQDNKNDSVTLDQGDPNYEFPCTESISFSKSKEIPTSVHQLRPGDLQVIASLGDSITAGFGEGSLTLLDVFREFRGQVWTTGGDQTFEKVLSISNILRKYNDGLKGSSTGTHLPSKKCNGFNCAVSGAIARDMPGQARTMIEAMKNDKNVDFEQDWKLVNLWIGGNDLCAVCKGGEQHFTENYIGYIEEALDILAAELPRTFVNLVSIIDVTKLFEVHNLGCDTLHSVVCGCGTSKDETVRNQTSAAAAEYQKATDALSFKDKYTSRDDFTVVLQPFYINTDIPRSGDKPDRSYFAPDCFHYTKKAHADAATALWNSMLEPVGGKRTAWTVGEEIECPTEEHPFLFTVKNSNAQAVDFI